MADYYKFQRRRLNVLMEGGEPAGGQWSFDEDNRKKVPKSMLSEIPELPAVDFGEIEEEARKHVEKIAPRAGNLSHLLYPTTREQAKLWLQRFLDERFNLFGPYEDAIVKNENWLWHSVLTFPQHRLADPRVCGGRSHRLRREEQRPPQLPGRLYSTNRGLA